MNRYGASRAILAAVASLFFLAACGSSGSSGSEAAASAPHPTGEAWLDPASSTFHAKHLTESCPVCHGMETFCGECHFGPEGSKVPKGEGWAHGTVPHDSLAPKQGVCNRCHELMRGFEEEPSTCHDCHDLRSAAHPVGEEWLNPESRSFHGTQAVRDSGSCATCHGRDFRGGAAGVSCYSCHFGPDGGKTPDGVSWAHGTRPHSFLSGEEEVCNRCHGLMRGFGEGPGQCHDCHEGTVASHATGETWLDPASATFHGAQAREDSSSCTACHGSDYRGGAAGPSCYSCHFGPGGSQVPAGSGWTHGGIPHSSFASEGAVCNACHGVMRDMGEGPDACHDCHGQQVSHPTGAAWLDPSSASFHGDQAARGASECAVCHGSDYRGGSAGVSCYTCHFGPGGSKVPGGESWNHGTVPHASLAENQSICNRCHDLTRDFGDGPGECHDCHGEGGHPTGGEWLDGGSATFHGGEARADSSACAVCHGTDFRGGSAGVSCYSCHFGPDGSRVPAGRSWSHGTVPHDSLASEEEVCTRCHDLTRDFRGDPAGCHDCHDIQRHPMGREWLDRTSATFHGREAARDSSVCAACHGSDFRGGSAGVSCFQCHFGPNGGKVPPGRTWTHGTIPHDSLASEEAVCIRCHALTRGFGLGPSDCHDCHAIERHPTGRAWLDVGSPTFHGDEAARDLSSCARCHGSDFRGGSAGVSCYGCHFGPDGGRVPSGSGWRHGTIPHSSLASEEPVCNRCHDLTRDFRGRPDSCHDCHGSGGGHPTGQPWLDKKSSSFHGDAAARDLSSCRACHGSDLRGGSVGVSCYTCHFDASGARVPPGVRWAHGTVPHEDLRSYRAVCLQCHGVNRRYGNPPSGCHDCHDD